MRLDAMTPGNRTRRHRARRLLVGGMAAAFSLALAAPAGALGSVFDGIHIDKPGRPIIGSGNQGGGTDDVSGFSAASDPTSRYYVKIDNTGDGVEDVAYHWSE